MGIQLFMFQSENSFFLRNLASNCWLFPAVSSVRMDDLGHKQKRNQDDDRKDITCMHPIGC